MCFSNAGAAAAGGTGVSLVKGFPYVVGGIVTALCYGDVRDARATPSRDIAIFVRWVI